MRNRRYVEGQQFCFAVLRQCTGMMKGNQMDSILISSTQLLVCVQTGNFIQTKTTIPSLQYTLNNFGPIKKEFIAEICFWLMSKNFWSHPQFLDL